MSAFSTPFRRNFCGPVLARKAPGTATPPLKSEASDLRMSRRMTARRCLIAMRATKGGGSESLKLDLVPVESCEAVAFHLALQHCHLGGQMTESLAFILRGIVYEELSRRLPDMVALVDKYEAALAAHQDADPAAFMQQFLAEQLSDSESSPDEADAVDESSSTEYSGSGSSSGSGSGSGSDSGSGSGSGSDSGSESDSGSDSPSTDDDDDNQQTDQQQMQPRRRRASAPAIDEAESERNDDDDQVAFKVSSSGSLGRFSLQSSAVDLQLKLSSNGELLTAEQEGIVFQSLSVSIPLTTQHIDRLQGKLIFLPQLRHGIRKRVRQLWGMCDKKTKNPAIFHAVCMKGKRPYMEDKMVVIENARELLGQPRSEPATSFLAVYDGHAGESAAVFCQMFLHWFVFQNPLYLDLHTRASHGLQLLTEAVLATEAAWCQLAEKEQLNGGCTAVLALLVGNALTVANVGDSRAVLCRAGAAVELSSIHSPSGADEQRRIEEAGGRVISLYGTPRVNGMYAVSRSIGDFPVRHLLIADPYVAATTITDDDEFLILASDGLWDVFSPDEAVAFTLAWYRQLLDGHTTEDISRVLFNEATARNSGDNITIIVLFFRERKQLKACGISGSRHQAR